MKILLYESEYLKSFEKGLKRHGVKYELRPSILTYDEKGLGSHDFAGVEFEPSDLSISFTCGIDRIKQQMDAGGRWLTGESSLLPDRYCDFLSFGYDGFFGTADYCNKNSPSDRWNKYWHGSLKPYKKKSKGNILLLGQKVWNLGRAIDYSLVKYRIDMYKTLTLAADFCMKNALPFKFRPHPNCRNLEFEKFDHQFTLEEDLENTKVAIVINSTVCVDLMLAGIPTITLHKESMTYPITKHRIKDIVDPGFPDRQQFCYDLAYCQWNNEEMESGECWEHLRQGMEKRTTNPEFKWGE